MSPLLLTVGGFLGAGKTTLIATAAQRLAARGRRVAVLTNDQAPDLVDTALVHLAGFPVAEVAGACFCCAFNDFAARAGELIATHRPDVLIAEPVGSCVDIAATVLRPLARERADVRIAPFTVCVDPAAWQACEAGALPPETVYIHRQQVQEADVVVLGKCDASDPALLDLAAERIAARNPAAGILRLSAATGAGVDAWLDAALAGADGGQQRIAVDYDTYAAGEAALGWLNAAVALRGPGDWRSLLRTLTTALAARCAAAGAPPAHLKILLESGGFCAVANAVTGRPEPTLRVLADGAATDRAQLTVNARVPLPAAQLRTFTEAAIAALPVAGEVRAIRAFPPGRPVPVHRIA